MYPSELKYSKTHEWVRVEDNIAQTGITLYAIEELTDLTYLQFDVEVGSRLSKGSTFGVIESVKATSDLYAQVSGKVVAINTKLLSKVEELAKDPYENGWMIQIEIDDVSEIDALFSVGDYETYLSELKH